MELEILTALNRERAARRAAIVVSDFADGTSRLFREGDAQEGELGKALARAFDTGRSGTVQVEGRELFLNVHLPPPRLVIIGAVHTSQALAPMARIAGFQVEVIDPRTAFATEERFPGVRLVAEWPDKVLEQRPFDAFTAVAAVTHDPRIDDGPLEAALKANCFYVGALGSRKTHAKRVERLRANGFDDADIARIDAPIGLAIGAANPPEIAVAVLAAVIQSLRSRGRRPDEQPA
jgi:xanthine dehydrogenase accessory factor